MTARTHDATAGLGLLVAIAISPITTPISLGTLIACIVANQLGGITPDIDQPTAPFWRNLPIGGIFGKLITKMLGGHRFITHSILGVAGIGWLVKQMLIILQPALPTLNIGYIWWAYMIGVLSHLIADSFTKEGVPWLLPIPVKFGFPPIKKLRITTDTWTEHFGFLPLVIILSLVVISQNYDILLSLFKNSLT